MVSNTNPDFSDLHDELRSVARDLLAAVPDGGAPDWRLLAESGWLGLEVPEPLDGAGVTFAEVAVILHEMGRTATRAPYLGTVLAVGALNLVHANAGRDSLLREIASGARVVSAAVHVGDIDQVSAAVPFHLDRAGDRVLLNGAAAFVPDAFEADTLLVVALDGDTPVVVELDPQAVGVLRTAQPVLDETRRLARVTATGVAVDDAALHHFVSEPSTSVQRLFDRASVSIAIDSLGVAEAMLEATVAYAGARQQFGRAIGSFQSVKHACADMFVQLTIARELVNAAIEQVTGGTGSLEASVTASMAKSFTTAAAVDVVGAAMQLHGGIGYTWESGVHVYLKRASLDRSLFGSPAAHRRRLAQRYLSA